MLAKQKSNWGFMFVYIAYFFSKFHRKFNYKFQLKFFTKFHVCQNRYETSREITWSFIATLAKFRICFNWSFNESFNWNFGTLPITQSTNSYLGLGPLPRCRRDPQNATGWVPKSQLDSPLRPQNPTPSVPETESHTYSHRNVKLIVHLSAVCGVRNLETAGG